MVLYWGHEPSLDFPVSFLNAGPALTSPCYPRWGCEPAASDRLGYTDPPALERVPVEVVAPKPCVSG